jgi:hypothetical protein
MQKSTFAIPFILGLNVETFLAEGRQFALQKFLRREERVCCGRCITGLGFRV